ncbi:hypothetical protein [Clostridium sp. P21]|uniref:hypothetical protein n=1 Tax=Clostridium muellerianum TaxID=2716538 RepID=UPI0019807094
MQFHIGNNVWIACNVVTCGGVNIGDNVVIGVGSVVTKDILGNYILYGNPCANKNDYRKKFKVRLIVIIHSIT